MSACNCVCCLVAGKVAFTLKQTPSQLMAFRIIDCHLPFMSIGSLKVFTRICCLHQSNHTAYVQVLGFM